MQDIHISRTKARVVKARKGRSVMTGLCMQNKQARGKVRPRPDEVYVQRQAKPEVANGIVVNASTKSNYGSALAESLKHQTPAMGIWV